MGLKRIDKSSGSTQTERHLADLAERSFLNLWSYPNPYRDQGTAQGKDGKELCDLLVVCGNDILVFSDKSVQFPDSGDLDLDWRRWFKRAVLHSARQLNGAERWITSHPDRIFLDKACLSAFPLEIPDAEQIRFHLVVVAGGSKKRCIQHFGSGSGSLLLMSDLKGESAHLNKNHVNYRPFAAGDIQPSKRFVHVLDEVTLDILLRELDTISDFLAYLRQKESYMRSGASLFITGEEELLACYLQNGIKGLPGFTPPEDLGNGPLDGVIIPEGLWEELKNDPQFVYKRQLDKQSYLWDRLITQFTKNMLDGTAILNDENTTLADIELAVRIMALEDRFKRRVLGQAIADAILEAEEGKRCFRLLIGDRKNLDGGTAYGFLQVPQTHKESGRTYEDYRNLRQALLYAYCINVKSRWPKLKYVIGIVTEPPKFYKELSEELFILQAEEVTEEMHAEAKELAEKFDIMHRSTFRSFEFHAQEYPSPVSRSRIRRNRQQSKSKGRSWKKKKRRKSAKNARRRNC